MSSQTLTQTVPEAVLDEEAVRRSLDVVIDPELDEPITDLGFVRSASVGPDRVEVHLRLPTSFCAPNFAWLMASDAKDAVTALVAEVDGTAPGGDGGRVVVVELDDHHDSDLINRGLAADAGYRGTFAHEAEDDLEDLRAIFVRKAHTAAMERALTALLRSDDTVRESELGAVLMGDLPDDATTESLRRRRAALGLGNHRLAPVLVDHHGVSYPADDVPMALRRARSTRISIDGNAHFCRGLLATRYPGADQDQTARGDEAFFSTDSLFTRPAATSTTTSATTSEETR